MPSPLFFIPAALLSMFLDTYFYIRDLFTKLLLCGHIISYPTLHEKCPYSEFCRSVFSPNMAKYGPEKIRIWTLFTHCHTHHLERANNKVSFSPSPQLFTQSIQQRQLISKSRYLSTGLISFDIVYY